MSSWREDFSILRHPGVGVLFFGRTLNMLGMAFAPVALAFGILHLPGGDERLLSVVLAAESIPLIVFLLVGGVIADRYPRHRVLFVSQAMAALAYGALAFLIGTGVNNHVVLSVAATISGIGGALGWPALSGLIPQIIPADKLQQGNAVLSFGVSLARIVGIVAGGAATALLGGGTALSVNAAMFAVAAGLALFMAPRRGTSPGGGGGVGSIFADLREGWHEFASREWLWVVVAQWALLIMVFTAAQSVLGPVIAERYLGGAGPWSWILAGQAVGDVLGVVLAMRWKPKHPILAPVLATALTVWVPFLLLAVAAPVWTVVVGQVLTGCSFSLFGVLWNTTMQREIPADALSRVSSYDAMGSMMFGPIGLLLAGPAATMLGPRPAMLGCAVILVVVGAAALVSRDVRTVTWREDAVDGHDVPAVPLIPEDPAPTVHP